MTVQNWQAAWQQLIGPGSPYEVVTPGDGSVRYFRNAAPDLLTALNAGRVHGEREFHAARAPADYHDARCATAVPHGFAYRVPASKEP